MTLATTPAWVVITNYPTWPSPYFAQLERFIPSTSLNLRFRPALEDLHDLPPGVVNLHRLKRLYQDQGGVRTEASAKGMLEQLDALRAADWRMVWSVHNLLPIDGPEPARADHVAADGVLARADMILCHTAADATHLAGRADQYRIHITGWGGLDGLPRGRPNQVTLTLAQYLTDSGRGILALGNITGYKGLPDLAEAFLDAAGSARLLIAGPCTDPGLAAELAGIASRSDDRVRLHLERIAPDQAHVLYAAADAALCPYRSDGPFEFFARVLHPSSVATAVGFGTPVIAPDLPSIREITEGQPRILYRPDLSPFVAGTDLESLARDQPQPAVKQPPRWRQIAEAYTETAHVLGCTRTQAATVVGISPPVARSSRMSAPSPTHPSETGSTDPDAVSALLADAYDLTADRVERLPIGQGTVNYRASIGGVAMFVKSYLPDTDLEAERAGIELSAMAGTAGVPVARVLTSAAGNLIAAGRSGTAISVWEFVDGQTIQTGLNAAQLAATGAALGQIHRTFAQLPASSGPAPQVLEWMGFDPTDSQATIDRILAIIADRAEPDTFDEAAETTLRERRADVGRIPALIAELPTLTAQVLHGDYSILNLMFNGDTLAAVVDFSPPDPFLIAYELGRIAFDPGSVTGRDDWIDAAATVIDGYLDTNPDVAPNDIHACARVAMIQLLTSLYGVKNHYLKAGLLQADLDAFWLLRHGAARRLLNNLDDIEARLHQLTRRP